VERRRGYLHKKIMKSFKFFFRVMMICNAIFFSFLMEGRSQEEKRGIGFFDGTWKEAKAKAKEDKKCLFLDAYASWCGPCKTMDKEIFTNTDVAHYFNEKFISLRIDMEKGEGPELAKKLQSIDGYPSMLFFNKDGSLVKTILGSRSVEELLQEAKLVAN
jgi:thiol:disulfide interchange protein